MVGVQVLTLTRDPDASLDQIAKVLETDPALSAKVLKTVNSSVYGLKTPCTTIRRALNFLGLSAVKSIVLGFSLVDSTRGLNGGDGFDINEHWRRSIFASAAARTIAQKIGKCDPEEAFAAALFQDLGVLAMFTALGIDYTNAVGPAHADHGRHAELELAALGFTHCECGAALAAKWRMPDRYVQTIQHHHTPDEADADCRDLVRTVGLGALTASALAGTDGAAQLPTLLACANQWFGLSSSDMAQLLTRVGQAASELGRLFGKPVGEVPDPAALMRQASEELVNQQIAAMRETESLRERNEALVRQTVTDALTGIGNRKRFQDEIVRLFEESRTIGRSVALVMCDGDKFKSVNDTHGHHVGDAVLKELASRIATSGGSAAIVCRYGGEEFAMLLPGAHIAEAAAIAESARAAVQNPVFDLSQTPGAPASLPVTISLGVACMDPGGGCSFSSIEALIEAADKALYAAKKAGRNRVCTDPASSAMHSAATETEVVAVAPAPAPATAAASAMRPSNAPQHATTRVPELIKAASAGAQHSVAMASSTAVAEQASGPGGSRVMPQGPFRLLVIEDDPLAARMIIAVIQKGGNIEVEWVKSVQAASSRLAESAANPARAISAIVSDFNLAGGTAVDVAALLRLRPSTVRMPIVVVSASDEVRSRQLCSQAGIAEFISKDRLIQELPGWVMRMVSHGTHVRAA
jgi:diguanylate cyclase (GGDEF)-like protein